MEYQLNISYVVDFQTWQFETSPAYGGLKGETFGIIETIIAKTNW